MHDNGGSLSVVVAHHLITLFQGGSMVLSRIAALHEVGEDGVGVYQGQPHLFGSFHHPYAPVDICGMAILQVVVLLLCDVGTYVESLMADEHALFE